MKKIKEKINKLFQEAYGIDDFGKTLMVFGLITYILGILFKNTLLLTLSYAGIIFAIYRILSRQHWDRREENKKYLSYVKLWKLKYENRKHSRIFMCKRCGTYIRVPKKKGKIQVTCTVCGDKTIHRT